MGRFTRADTGQNDSKGVPICEGDILLVGWGSGCERKPPEWKARSYIEYAFHTVEAKLRDDGSLHYYHLSGCANHLMGRIIDHLPEGKVLNRRYKEYKDG